MRHGLIPIRGPWHLDTNAPVVSLNYGTGEEAYWLPLDCMQTAEAVLDTIAQVAGKASIPSTDIGDLVRSLRFLLDLQPLLVSGCMHGAKSRRIEDPERVALQSVRTRVLPCEEPELESRLPQSETGLRFYSVADWLRAETETLAARRRSKRFRIAQYGLSVLRRKAGRTSREAVQ